MGAYKQFTTKDVVITPFNVHKGFFFTGNQTTGSDVGIEFYNGVKPLTLNSPTTSSGLTYTSSTAGIYNSIKHLYYTNFLSSSTGDLIPTQSRIPGTTSEFDEMYGKYEAPRFENYLQSTLTQSRYFPTESNSQISVISIPSKLYGENIVPQTFSFSYTSSLGAKYDVSDDGEGNLISSSQVIGQIFYPHGLAVITSGSLNSVSEEIISGSLYPNLDSASVAFSSSITIYENQYKCTIRENEFQYSMNPSLLSGSSDNTYHEFVTGSFFTPYVTTVGLYNNKKELLVIGKFSQPIPIPKLTDLSIIINFDT